MEVRKLPEQEERVETGAVQFGEDWPGIFIRGDNAISYAMYLRLPNSPFREAMILSLINLLEGSRVQFNDGNQNNSSQPDSTV